MVTTANGVHYKGSEIAKTGITLDTGPRSERVIAAYKRHKLSISALRHIRNLLRQFERDRALDRRFAWYGIAIIVAVLAFAALSRLASGQITIF